MSNDRSALTSIEREKASVFHSWSAQASIAPLMIRDAQGVFVTGEDGTTYLDFSSQLVNTNIGHQHPSVVRAIQEQAGLLCTIAPQHGYEARYHAAELILDHSFDGAAKVFFTNAGAEAVEHAVRMARLHTGRRKVLATYRSYHGGTATSINLTGDPRRWASDDGSSGAVHFFGPFLYRSAYNATTEEEECARALESLENTIRFEGPAAFAAIILESVPGTAGIMVPPKGFLKGVREICDRYGMVYIADEVMCGFGRTGSWFAYQDHDVKPDLVTFAKGVNSGYVPLGGVVINEAISATFNDRVYPGGLTYSGHPLACASAVASMKAMEDEHIVENAKRIGDEVLRPGLEALAAKHKIIGDVRGLGVFFALELVTDRATKEPLAPYAASSPAMNELVAACRNEGLLIFNNFNRLHVVPPCTITDAEAREGLARLDRALDVGDKYYVGA
ncbi:MAG TPA: aspartate aminotransferase family protein [Acidimicrobiales bacterium]|jgi:taurine--2-oxoglutarate transaminase|nr:aspartate aminotransferase family protein [Acidimicrobiales bacterium]